MHTTTRRTSAPGVAATVAALGIYLTTLVPAARREIAYWRRRAERIPDDELRRLALLTLADEHLNAEAAAVFALLAPRRRRCAVATLCTGWQVMYDYLDTVSEQPSDDPLANGLQLHTALIDAVSPAAGAGNHYLHHPHRDDGGYLSALAATSRARLHALPGAAAVTDVVLTEARRCGEAQSHTHAAVLNGGTAALRAWAASAGDNRLRWFETAAAGISSLAVLALLGAAGDPRSTPAEARLLASTYAPWICALSTLLDSLVDLDDDEATGNFSYTGQYEDPEQVAQRMAMITRECAHRAQQLRHAGVHQVIVAGLAGFYLSAAAPSQRPSADLISRELEPAIAPILAFMRWRRGGKFTAEHVAAPAADGRRAYEPFST